MICMISAPRGALPNLVVASGEKSSKSSKSFNRSFLVTTNYTNLTDWAHPNVGRHCGASA